MEDVPDLAAVAALIGDPVRARMLMALLGGRSLTATELAIEGGVTPSTTSSHLARLAAAGLIVRTRFGRHQYIRLAGTEIAVLLETLGTFAPAAPRRATGPTDEGMRRARICYDHLAGEYGVRLLDRLRTRDFVAGDHDGLTLTPEGEAWSGAFGIDIAALRAARRLLCRPCLDWSERRLHLGGALGAAILERLFALRYARREPAGRALAFTPRGLAFLDRLDVPPRRAAAS